MKPDDRIRFALGRAIRFVAGRREDLDRDAMLTFALLHAIQTGGEAAYKISPETRPHPQIPWA